jgi:hypothetical protein
LRVPFEQRRADRRAVAARNGFQDELKAGASSPLKHLHAASGTVRSEYRPIRSGEGKSDNYRPARRCWRGGWHCRHKEEQPSEVSCADRLVSVGVSRTIIAFNHAVLAIIEKLTHQGGELFAACTTLRRSSQGGTGHDAEAQYDRQPNQAL